MTKIALLFGVLLLLLLVGLFLWRALDHRADKVEFVRLLALQPTEPALFDRSMVETLPEPARRYFHFAIKERTPLFTVAEISMRGQFGMGDKSAPNYLPMRAKQVLAVPEGFIWKMSGGSGVLRVSGSDSASWTRFWLAGIVPVARAGGTRDHALSSLGRYLSEAVFWTPAAVLPRPDVVWTALDKDTARVTVTRDGAEQAVDVTVDPEGRPVRVFLQRWSNANPDGVYQLQPFGGTLSAFREVEGFRIPTHVEAGNFMGTDAYFPFFIADVTDIRFDPLSGG
ncbi:hypothetical protein HKX54_06765 [Sulfitobacter sp. M57]|uniref:DUF6544 family protein n=1 Tax=unclassified Sulfitobacter TaxID=196795 RepID=UPI0023E1DDC1|nr:MULTISPECIES: DUF6544 family protein [unclassified Sulfitobacter]MDF3414151.1 hypothetical protein [Sulfitobacter sp. KE5]MDF3420568.1 hypothetical protein [Sulfitobacter sp. KE43]MDF3432697.1 hypothetical protein [Sulfitobacter sp. KE42]MDF3458336.1 hypothetical protein [Sulfitobacter sp. S74]MDF3462237.1 hypothetical protein [Sulfitobacter sp. Ks18]